MFALAAGLFSCSHDADSDMEVALAEELEDL
jgi:hypothetical protein